MPQAAGPVRVLLTPQNRTTYLRRRRDLRPDPGVSAHGRGQSLLSVAGLQIDEPSLRIAETVPEEFRRGLLAALMAQVGEGADLADFNRALVNMQIPLALER